MIKISSITETQRLTKALENLGKISGLYGGNYVSASRNYRDETIDITLDVKLFITGEKYEKFIKFLEGL